MVHPPTRRLEGYVVMPKANTLAPSSGETGPEYCAYEVTGEYTLRGRGGATASRCADTSFGLDTEVPYAAIHGSFCPSCTTYYEGTCTRSNTVVKDEAAKLVASDVECYVSHELAGELHVKAHLEGPVIITR